MGLPARGKTGMGARKEPMFVTITAAGTDVQGVCYEQYKYACSVRDGLVEDPTYYPLIFETAEDDDIWDEATWLKANPSAGAFRDLEEIRLYAKRAKVLPTLELSFRRLYLNQWVQDLTRWMKRAHWNACGGELRREALLGRPCYAGLDLSSTDDFSALVLVLPFPDGTFDVLPFFWIPQARLANRRKNGVSLEPWVRQGFLEVTPGEVVDYNFILACLARLNADYDIQEVAFDRWGAAKLRADIENIGFTLVQFGQGFGSMSSPMKELERLVIDKQIHHGDHPVLAWKRCQ